MINLKQSLTLMSAVMCTTAVALSAEPQAEQGSYEMASYSNSAGGQKLLEGDYEAAIAAASRTRSGDAIDSLVANTNLCVAHTVMREFSDAEDACEKALRIAKRIENRRYTGFTRGTATAKALSNRGVLRALSGNTTDAAVDFRKAANMHGAWSASVENLAHLERTHAYRLGMARTSD